MTIWILTLFPEYFHPFFKYGVSSRAFRKFKVKPVFLRQYAKHGKVDDNAYGGGPGMVMRADILEKALLEGVGQHLKGPLKERAKIICPSPQGTLWTDAYARKFAETSLQGERDLVFICGRYEGIDQRFMDKYVETQISLGDFILTGGELAVMSILDSSFRFIPSILGNQMSARDDSFSDGLLEGPLYTRPYDFHGQTVPDVLRSGDHTKILGHQKKQKIETTRRHRPDLWEKKS